MFSVMVTSISLVVLAAMEENTEGAGWTEGLLVVLVAASGAPAVLAIISGRKLIIMLDIARYLGYAVRHASDESLPRKGKAIAGIVLGIITLFIIAFEALWAISVDIYEWGSYYREY